MSYHHPLALRGGGLVRDIEITERDMISGESVEDPAKCEGEMPILQKFPRPSAGI
jgi:hypothetical protein